MKSQIELIRQENQIWTNGLWTINHPEIRVQISDLSLLDEAMKFVAFVADYVVNNHTTIKPGETLVYGYWLTLFQSASESFLDAWEFNASATQYELGITRTLKYRHSQQQVCLSVNANYEPPCADQLVVISDGILEGEPLQAVRYPSPEHMSGWWLTTKKYNGEIKSLRREHFYHVTAIRPEIIQYIALPYGYRFYLGNGKKDVWFDKKVAERNVG